MTRHTKRRNATRHAFLVAEIAIGVALLGALAVALTVMVQRHNAAAVKSQQQRDAARAASAILLSMQSEAVSRPEAPGMVIQIEPGKASADALGWRWVRVRVESEGQSAELHGLVRTDRVGRIEEGGP